MHEMNKDLFLVLVEAFLMPIVYVIKLKPKLLIRLILG